MIRTSEAGRVSMREGGERVGRALEVLFRDNLVARVLPVLVALVPRAVGRIGAVRAVGSIVTGRHRTRCW